MFADYGRVIRAELERRGYYVLWHETFGADLVICFDLIGSPELPWSRAFIVPVEQATPDAFEKLLNAMKAGILEGMARGEASDTVKSVMSAYGSERLSLALTRREGMH